MKRLALVGFGASGLFALKELAGANVEVHVFDVGPTYGKRYACPITQGVLEVCPPSACSYCAPGQSAGSWNDFKVICTASEVIGGRLAELIGLEDLQRRLDVVRRTILDHSPSEIPIASPNRDDLAWINEKAAGARMVYHHQVLLHCGSDRAPAINTNILESITKAGSNIVFHWGTKVLSLARQGPQFLVRYEKYRCKEAGTDPEEAVFDMVVVSVGRGGANWLTQQEFYQALDIHPGQVDIGVRVETHGSITAELDKRFYEPKLYFRSSAGDVVRNFCSNPGGFVVPENHRDYVLVNGHAMAGEKSPNNNFAILVRQTFTRPFKNPQLYSQTVAKTVNMLAGGGPLVQRFGDLRLGNRTWSLDTNWIRPTLQAQCGNLALGYPHRLLEGLKEYLLALAHICPGIDDDATLWYGPECKSYPDSLTVTKEMETTTIPNLWIIGDSSSWTRGVGQAACSGLLAGEGVKRKLAS
jgi:uncharacterized FAD-dependent dehydrogenase